MKKTRYLFLATLVVLLAGCSNGGGGGDGGDTIIYAKDFVKIQPGWTCSGEYEYMTFKGKIKNASNEYDLKYVELRVTVLKADGTVINTNTGYMDSDTLFKSQTSTFDIMASNPGNAGTKCQMAVEDASFVK